MPNGPRTPTTSPIFEDERAWLTAPTSRTVCSIAPGAPGAELIEIAISPTPNTVSMLNCPALKASIGSSTGSSHNVVMSNVSGLRSTRR